MGGLLDTTWLSWLLPHLLPSCWVSSRQGLSWRPIPGGDSTQPQAESGLLGGCAPVPPLSIPPPKSTSAEQTSRPRALPTSIRTTVTVQSSCSARCCCSWLPKRELPSQSSEQLNPSSIAHPQPSSSRTFAPARQIRVGFLRREAFGIHHISPLSVGHREGVQQPKAELTQSDPVHIHSQDGERPPPGGPWGVPGGKASQHKVWVPAERGGILRPATPPCKPTHAGVTGSPQPLHPCCRAETGCRAGPSWSMAPRARRSFPLLMHFPTPVQFQGISLQPPTAPAATAGFLAQSHLPAKNQQAKTTTNSAKCCHRLMGPNPRPG